MKAQHNKFSRKAILPLFLMVPFSLSVPASISHAIQAETESQDSVTVDEFGTVDIQVDNTPLPQVLQMLSMQSRKNIIASKNVAGTVTANLYDVTFYEALDAILRGLGYGYIERGNFIYVYTLEELRELRPQKRETKLYHLNYLSATDAESLVQPLLSEGGKISSLGSVDPGVSPDRGNAGHDSWAYEAVIVVNDYEENLESISMLIEDVDTPPDQVVVEATIVSTLVDEGNAWGVDFSVIAEVDFTSFTNPLSAVNNLLQGNNNPGDKADDSSGYQPANNKAFAMSSTPGNVSGPGTFKLGVITDPVSVFLRALDEVTDSVILARPRVITLNRQRAHVLVGKRVAYLQTTNYETSSTTSVQYLDTGVQLIFRPFISKDGSIRLELAPSVSEAQLRQITDAFGGGLQVPDEITNEIITNVRVEDGQTIVLGGLFEERTQIGRRQVPFLGDLPLLDAVFRGQEDKVQRREIIFLITPTIVHDKILDEWGEEALAYTDAARIGIREGLLPFSREYLSGNHAQDAMRAMADGDETLAIYHLENSLRLNPNQPELVQLQSRMTSDPDPILIERDMLEQIIDAESPEPAEESSGSSDAKTDEDQKKTFMAENEVAADDEFDAMTTDSAQESSADGDHVEVVAEASDDQVQDFYQPEPQGAPAGVNDEFSIDQNTATDGNDNFESEAPVINESIPATQDAPVAEERSPSTTTESTDDQMESINGKQGSMESEASDEQETSMLNPFAANEPVSISPEDSMPMASNFFEFATDKWLYNTRPPSDMNPLMQYWWYTCRELERAADFQIRFGLRESENFAVVPENSLEQ